MMSAGSVQAQFRLTGQVLDASTRDPLPSATVQVQNSSRGTVTNANGQFALTVGSLPVTLEIRFIGYKSQTFQVDTPPSGSMEILMDPVLYSLEELVVTGENPAYNIMRQVLLAKKRMRSNLRSTYADLYTRFMLYSGEDLAQMTESVRASWWTPEGGTREVLRAERKSPPYSGSFLFAQPHNTPNVYDDDIDLMGTRYASPLHPKALDYYVFTLGNTREFDGRKAFDIYFAPVSPTMPAFTGHIAVLDSVYAVLEADIRPHPATNVLPPVQDHDLYLEQRFSVFGDSLWLPVSLTVQGRVSFGRTGVQYPMARYEQTSALSLQVINPPVPDSLAQPGPAVVRHPLATRSDHLFARNPSFIPLTPKELQTLATIRPGMTIDQAFRPEGILAGYAAFPVTEENKTDREDPDAGRFSLAKRIAGGDWFWYNRVDGWHPGLSYGSVTDNAVRWRTSVGYSTLRKRLSHRAQVNVPWTLAGLKGYVGLELLDATSVVARTEELGRFVPGFATYLGYNDLYDYYNRRAATFNIDFEPENTAFVLSLRGHSEVHGTLEKLTHHEGWLFHNVQPENPAIRPGDLRSVEIWSRIGNDHKSALDLSYERSPGATLGSDWTFSRLEARGTIRFTTFYSRRARPNWFRLTALGGTSFGDLPTQRQFTLSGSAGPFSEFTGFRTLKSSRFVADQLGGVFWAHDFTTALFEKLGLWGLADRGVGLYVFGGHAFSSRVTEIGKFGGRYHEIGAGISYPFGMPFRIEVATGSDREYSFRFGRPLK